MTKKAPQIFNSERSSYLLEDRFTNLFSNKMMRQFCNFVFDTFFAVFIGLRTDITRF